MALLHVVCPEALVFVCSFVRLSVHACVRPQIQGAYNSGKLRENSGNLKFTRVIFMCDRGRRVLCLIVSNSSIDWLGGTVSGVGGASYRAA